jgi:predicted  nucleic acid-binding Zn-ribbon protein
MLYYILMNENVSVEKKPIKEVLDNLVELTDELKEIKLQIHHIKEYIRKETLRKKLDEEQMNKIENEYVKPTKGWFW